MSATYDPDMISTTDGDIVSAVRWLIQDTDITTAEISNEEIEALYADTDSDDSQKVRTYDTAFFCAQALERKYRKQASYSSGKSSFQLGERAKAWAKAVDDLALERFSVRQIADGRSGGLISVSRPPSYDEDSLCSPC